jgi:hypothetical protein
MKLIVEISDDFYANKIARNIRPTTEELEALVEPIYNGVPLEPSSEKALKLKWNGVKYDYERE